MMRRILLIGVGIWIFMSPSLLSQEIRSKGDKYFYSYAFADAIVEYKKETTRAPLSLLQIRNLAEAYEKTGNETEALYLYQDLFQRDTSLPKTYVNRMLNLILRNEGTENVREFVANHPDSFSPEVMENAAFNYEIAGEPLEEDSSFRIFSLEINTPHADFAPSFFGDNLLFTSSRSQETKDTYAPTGESYLDIFVGKVQGSGDVTSAVPYTVIEDSRFHQATPYYSSALNKLFYIRSNERNGRLSFDQNGKNTLAMGVSDFQNRFNFLMRDLSTSFYYPFFDEATEKLYFAAEFEDSFGGTDIYYVHTNNGQIMSAPVNLGPKVNTPGNEISPFIYENSLYFASDIFYGLGGMDLYKSEMGPGDFFSIPINLGGSINTIKDEFGFIVQEWDEEGLMGYFSSNRSEGLGKDDIYGFKVKKAPKPKTLLLKGHVVTLNTDDGIPEAVVRIQGANEEILKEVVSDETGAYQIEVPWQEQITLICEKTRYSIFRKKFDVSSLEAIGQSDINIGIIQLDDIVEEKEGQTVLKLKKFWFDKGKSKLTAEIEAELDKVVEAILMFPNLQLRIEAHTDSRGGSSTNFRLSQQRADVIKSYLEVNGVPSSNILYTIGYGEEKILNNCTNGVYCLDVLHKRNERHLIVVLNYNFLF